MPLPTNLRIHLAPTGAASRVVDADTGEEMKYVTGIRCGAEAEGMTYLEVRMNTPTIVIDGETHVIYQMNEDDLRRVAGDMGFKLVVD